MRSVELLCSGRGLMLSYVFMKILERRPRSYDRRMNAVSRGRARAVKDSVAAEVPEGARVLEVGCGTGELAAMLVRERGARVDAFDLSPSMVEVARERIEVSDEELSVWQMGVEGMDGLEAEAYDAVVSTLVFSELSEDELRFALDQARRVVRPGGRLVVAAEVWPRSAGRRALHALARAPILAATYLVSRGQTRPVEDLSGRIEGAGLVVDKEERSQGDAFALVVAIRPLEECQGISGTSSQPYMSRKTATGPPGQGT